MEKTVLKHIEKLNASALAYMVRNYPRLEEKFRQIVRDEYTDGNIAGADILDFTEKEWLK